MLFHLRLHCQWLIEKLIRSELLILSVAHYGRIMAEFRAQLILVLWLEFTFGPRGQERLEPTRNRLKDVHQIASFEPCRQAIRGPEIVIVEDPDVGKLPDGRCKIRH